LLEAAEGRAQVRLRAVHVDVPRADALGDAAGALEVAGGELMSETEHARDAAVAEADLAPDARCRGFQLSRRLRHLAADLEFLDGINAPFAGDHRGALVAAGSRPVATRLGTRKGLRRA
jgi:hypothetical protein